MKTNIFNICLPMLLLCGAITSGCEQDDLWEIFPDSETTAIKKVVDGFEFKFCLLNEAGEAATVFNEGENFAFYFSVTNKTNENFYFFPGFAYPEFIGNDFCKVYGSNDQDYGKPYTFSGYNKIGIAAYPFNADETVVFEQPWVDSRDSIWRWEHGFYESTHQEFLEKGSYRTEFKYRFEFVRTNDAPTLYTDTLTFKINFKIQ